MKTLILILSILFVVGCNTVGIVDDSPCIVHSIDGFECCPDNN